MTPQEHAWTTLGEEALEIAHAISKAIRFSHQDGPPEGTTTNLENICTEIAQFEAMKSILTVEYGIDFNQINAPAVMQKKRQAFAKFLNYSRDRGTLIDDKNGFYKPGLQCPENRIFVFESNLEGRHTAGTTKGAFAHYGAKMGQAEGLMGHSYGIPTLDMALKIRSIAHIEESVRTFCEYTRTIPLNYYVTPIGCGLTGLTPEVIAPMFKGAVRCLFPQSFRPFLEP